MRREHPALGAGDAVDWLEAPDGVLAFRRDAEEGPFVCTVNLTRSPVAVPSYGRVLLASGDVPVAPEADEVLLPADTAVWWAV